MEDTSERVPNHDYKNLWLSPRVPVLRMRYLIKRYGLKRVLAHPLCKSEREAWVTAVFLLGNAALLGLEYWLEVETGASTPDTYVYYLERRSGRTYRWVVEFEITDYEEHSESLVEVIKKKCAKNYPPTYFLLIYYRRPQATDLRLTQKELENFNIPFSYIYIVSSAEGGDDKYQITCLYPKSESTSLVFDMEKALDRIKDQPDFGTSLKRGSSTTPTPLGMVSLPYPKLK